MHMNRDGMCMGTHQLVAQPVWHHHLIHVGLPQVSCVLCMNGACADQSPHSIALSLLKGLANTQARHMREGGARLNSLSGERISANLRVHAPHGAYDCSPGEVPSRVELLELAHDKAIPIVCTSKCSQRAYRGVEDSSGWLIGNITVNNGVSGCRCNSLDGPKRHSHPIVRERCLNSWRSVLGLGQLNDDVIAKSSSHDGNAGHASWHDRASRGINRSERPGTISYS